MSLVAASNCAIAHAELVVIMLAGARLGSRTGITLSIGGLTAIIALAIGLAYQRPTAMRMTALQPKLMVRRRAVTPGSRLAGRSRPVGPSWACSCRDPAYGPDPQITESSVTARG